MFRFMAELPSAPRRGAASTRRPRRFGVCGWFPCIHGPARTYYVRAGPLAPTSPVGQGQERAGALPTALAVVSISALVGRIMVLREDRREDRRQVVAVECSPSGNRRSGAEAERLGRRLFQGG